MVRPSRPTWIRWSSMLLIALELGISAVGFSSAIMVEPIWGRLVLAAFGGLALLTAVRNIRLVLRGN